MDIVRAVCVGEFLRGGVGDFGEDEGGEGGGIGAGGGGGGVLAEDCGAVRDAGAGRGGLAMSRGEDRGRLGIAY